MSCRITALLTKDRFRSLSCWLRPRFSLRALLALVTLFGVWLPLQMERAKEQKKAVRRIHGIWGSVTYDYQAKFGITAVSSVPHWLRGPLGDDFFHSVVAAEVHGDCEDIGRLLSLRQLSIRDTAVNDADVQCLARLHGLRELSIISSERLPPAGALALTGRYTVSTSQPAFILHGGRPYSRRLSDSALRVISQLPQLEVLHIEGANFTSEGLSALARSHSLRIVDIATCDERMTADAAARLRQMGRIREFRLVRWTDENGEEVVSQW
jgi:hypothetical protein